MHLSVADPQKTSIQSNSILPYRGPRAAVDAPADGDGHGAGAGGAGGDAADAERCVVGMGGSVFGERVCVWGGSLPWINE